MAVKITILGKVLKKLSDEMNEVKKEFEGLKEALRRAGISV